MIRLIISLAAVFLIVAIGLGVFLQPDDLKDCNDKPSLSSNCKAVDAIVAVSGGDTEARTNQAIAMYKNGWSDKLIFSGAAQDKSGPSNAAAMKIIAINDGVPESAIYLDERSETTKQNAENSQTIFAKLEVKKVILVTSGYHQRRASLEFNKRTKVMILNHPVASDKDWSNWWWVTPRGWWLAISESVKIAFLQLYLGSGYEG